MKYLSSLIFGSALVLGLSQISTPSEPETTSTLEASNLEIPAPSNCPVSPYPTHIIQSDGSNITLIGKGNMLNSWTETTDGYTIVPVNGVYEYAQKVNGDLQPTGMKANDIGSRSIAEFNFLANVQKGIQPDFSPLKNSVLSQVNAQLNNKTFPTTGSIRVLAILIDYPDLQSTFPSSNFDSLLYGSNYRSGDGSFKTFYETASNGQLSITVDVMGWYRAANNFMYYSRDSGYPRAADLVREAVDAAETAGANFANYDNDNDGDVDGILTVHAGPGAEQGNRREYIWSHRWVLNGGTMGSVTYDGKFINDYMMNPETRISGANQNMVGIGVFCHEFGHNLGLPDLYDTDPNLNGDSEGIGNWCLMAGGGWLGGEHRPINFSAWCRVENNWDIPSVKIVGTSSSDTLQPASTTQNEIIQINTAVPNEYFLIENRQKVGLDLELPGTGLAVFHINSNKTGGGGVNADEADKGVDLEEADGNADLDNEVNRGDAGDLFPGSSNNTTFDDNSNPSARNNSLAATGIQLRNISENGTSLSFDFGPAPAASCSGGTTTLTATNDNFSDGSGPSNYANNLTCSWLIQPTGANSITFGFTNLATEINQDFVRVYDGTSNAAPLLASYSGTNGLNTATSTTGSMFVEFTTDGTGVDAGWDAFYTSSTTGPGCSGLSNLTMPNSSFSDGSGPNNYDNNQSCAWLIQPNNGPITLSFTSFSTEAGADVLRVYDGINNSATQIGNFSGSSIPANLTSSGNALFLEFVTDGTTVDAGWDANYTTSSSTCSGTTNQTGTNGTFTDGSGPNLNYSDGLACNWLISVSGSNVIQMQFDSLDLLAGDTVFIYDGGNNNATLIGAYSGNVISAIPLSTSNDAFIEFVTDGSNNDKGWQISYSGLTDCSGLTNLTAPAGIFSDGSLPNLDYASGSNCTWLIQPPGANFITLNFNRFDTENGFDFVEVFDGNSSTSTSLGRFSGNSIPPSLVSTGGSLFVEFTSDNFIEETGWEAQYNSTTATCLQNRLLTTNTGVVTDGSGSNNYDNNSNCSWIIQPPVASNITLTFTSFDTESGVDLVNIYDGPNNSGSLIGSYSGNTLPPQAVLNGSNKIMYVEFISDGANTAGGFTANYTSVSAITCSGTTAFTAPSGAFEDGSGPSVYDNNLNCGWLIQPTGSPVSITLNMTAMALANFGDRVRVYDGNNNTGTPIGFFNGTNTGNPVTAFSGSMFVEFVTDGSIQGQGFNATYSSSNSYCSPSTTFTNNFGSFTDGSPNGTDYLPNTDCAWLIQPTTPNIAVRLTLSQFATESGNDTLTVYDGANASAPILGTFSGTLVGSNVVTSSGGDMYVTFKSNGSVNDNGWRAFYATQAIPACAGTTSLTAVSGTFDDGSAATADYIENSNCQWLIQPPGANIISLSFNRFSTQTTFDFVRVYDGSNASAPLLGTFSGNNLPPTINSSGGSLYVTFTSNGFTNETGWEANYNSSTDQCFNNLLLTAFSDTIEDGSGSNFYQPNLNCSWIIQPPTATSITLDFLNFDVNTTGDTLYVYDGTDNLAPLLAKLTGNVLPGNISSSAGSLYLEFQTNGSLNAPGWRLAYSITSNLSCFGTTNLTASSGNFDDGSGTGVYDNNLGCSWLISPPGNPAVIVLTMNNLALANFGDFVRVYDGVDNTGNIIRTFFGSNTGNPVSAFSGNMFIEFTTDGTNQGQGWDASYSSSSSYCAPNTTLTNNFGNFTDGSPFGTNYLDNTNCEWLIQPTTPNLAIRLNLFQFNTEAGFDSVTVYDGANASAPILGSFSGNLGTVPAMTSSGGSMFVTFITDGNTNASGWRANYNTQQVPFCSGQTTLTTSSGTFDDGSGIGVNYVRNSNCEWLIQPAGGAITIDLNFNYFSTQNNFDFVNVYDGTDNTAPQLGSFSGNSIPGALQATSGAMFLEFTTNGGVELDGWEATYTSTNTFTLDASPDTITINAGAGSTGNISVTSNTNWSTSDNAVWLIASPFNGVQNQTVTALATQPNIGPERYAEVYITASTASLRDTVVVVQRASGNFLDANPDTLFFAANPGTSQNAVISSSVSWTASPGDTWITASPANGSNNGTSVINVQQNTSTVSRTSFVVVSGNLGVANDTVFVKQDGRVVQPPSLSVDPSSITLAAANGSSDIFAVNSTVTWQTSTPATWLTVTNPAVTVDTNTVLIATNSANPNITTRSSYVAVQDAGGTLFDTVFVTQLGTGPALVVNPDTVFLNANMGSTGSATLQSNVNWSGTPTAAWFSASPLSGSGISNTSIAIVSSMANPSPNDRVAFIAFEDFNTTLFDTVFVVQRGTPNIVSTDPDTIRLTSNSGAQNTYNVLAPISSSWTSSPDDNWISLNPGSGTGSAAVTVTANTANPSTAERLTFIVTADVSLPIPDTVFVIQEGAAANALSVTPNNINLNFNAGSNDIVQVSSNTNWTINNPVTWLDLSSSSGTGNATITLTANSDNLSGINRTANLSFDSPGLPSQLVSVTQVDGSIPNFALSADTVYVSNPQGSTETFAVQSNIANWSLTESTPWLLVNPLSGSNTQTVTVLAASRNTFGNDRSAWIRSNAPGFSDDSVLVIQEGAAPFFQVAPGQIILGGDSLDEVQFNISSNLIQWDITENSPWMEVSAYTGSFTQRLSVTAIDSNNTGDVRSDTLFFNAAPMAEQFIVVTQDTALAIGLSKETDLTQLSLYPNPNAGQFTLELNQNVDLGEAQIQVLDMLGKSVEFKSYLRSNRQIDIDLEEQAAGIYFLSIQLGEERISRKISVLDR